MLAERSPFAAASPGVGAYSHPAWLRLEDQLAWYDGKSVGHQRAYKRIKITQVVLAAAIPFFALAGIEYAPYITAGAGALIAVLEGVQQLGQYSSLWITYRATAERLKHEKYLFLSVAGPYRAMPVEERLVVLAERVEESVSSEHANWIGESRQAATRATRNPAV